MIKQEIIKELKANTKLIEKDLSIIKSKLKTIQDTVSTQCVYLQLYKETSLPISELATELQTTPSELLSQIKSFNKISNSNTISKQSMIELGILEKSNRKTATRNIKKNSLLKASTAIGQIRSLKEQGMAKNDTNIIKQLLNTLINEL